MEVALQCQIHPHKYFIDTGDPVSHIFTQFAAPESFDPKRKIRENKLWQGFGVEGEEVRPGVVDQTVEIRGSDLTRIHMRLPTQVLHQLKS
jgi:hypothetical protein